MIKHYTKSHKKSKPSPKRTPLTLALAKIIYMNSYVSPVLPCFLDLNAATKFFKHIFSSVMIDNKYTVLLVWPFISFENSHWRS